MKLLRAQVEFKKARDMLRSQQTQAASDRENLVLKLDRARRDVSIAESAIDMCILRAPRSGVVVIRDHPWERRKLQAGDGVWVGVPIAQLPDLDSLQINAALADVDDGRVVVGMPVVVTVDGYPSMHFPGRIASISPVAQERMKNEIAPRLQGGGQARSHRRGAHASRPVGACRSAARGRSRTRCSLPGAHVDFSSAAPRVRLAGGRLVSVDIGSCNTQECVVRGGLKEGQALAAGGVAWLIDAPPKRLLAAVAVAIVACSSSAAGPSATGWRPIGRANG